MTSPARFLLLLLAGAMLALPASAGARSACPASATRIAGGPHGRVACVPRKVLTRAAGVRATPPAVERALETSLLRHRPPGRAAGIRRSAAALRRLAASPALLRALTPATASRVARASGATTADPHLTAEPIGQQQAGEAGSGVRAYIDAGGHMGFGMGDSAYATQCPAADGSLPVRGTKEMQMSLPSPLPHKMTNARQLTATADGTGTGHVGDDGKLIDFDVVVNVSIRQTDTVYGPAGLVHGTPSHREFTVHVAMTHVPLTGPVPALDTGPLTWIGSMDPQDGFFRAYMLYAQLIERLRSSLAFAQTNFYDLAACVRATYDPPSATLAPSAHRQIHATISSSVDGGPVSMDVTANAADGGAATPVTQHADGSASYDYRAPDHETTTLTHLSGASKRGRLGGQAVTIKVVKADAFPHYYKVLSASFHTSAGAKQTGTTASCNAHGYAIGGANDFTGAAGALAFDATNRASMSGSQVAGQVFASVPAQWAQHLFGCTDHGDGTYSSCTTDRQDTPQPDGTWPIGFTLEADSADAATAHLQWSVPDAFVGYGAGGNPVCNVSELRQYVPFDATQQDVPMATLAGTAPFTLSFTGGPLSWATTNTNRPAAITYDWSFTLQLQRVDANGAPLA